MQRKGIVSVLSASVLLPGFLAVLMIACASPTLATEGDSYSQDVERMSDELTTVDCARCHYEIFLSIRNGQGAHRMECRQCHETFHSFRRGMNYQEVLPVCSTCHGSPHGDSEQMTTCKSCHTVPHAPLASLDLKILAPSCALCHTDAGTRMAKGRVDHNKLQCILCHSDHHGSIPTCQECHGTPHPDALTEGFADCLDCHGNPHDLELEDK